MKLTDDEMNAIIDVLDPLCRHRYEEGQALPRGYETSTAEQVNKIQQFRETAARSKARRIKEIIEKGVR